jgi:opacity protein-like surface antigen
MDYNFTTMKNFRCFLLFMFIAIAVPAHAQSDVTILGAVHSPGKLTLQTAAQTGTTISNFNPSSFGAFGLRFGHGRVYGGEHTFMYAPNFLEANTKAILYNSNVLVQAPLPKAKPYGTVGLGTIISFGTDEEGRPAFGKIGTKFALNYGGGLKVLPAGPVGIRFDIRGYLVPGVKFNMPTLQNQTIKTESENLHILEVGAGIVFAFGGNN